MIRGTFDKASRFVQKEARVVVPAASRAAVHGAKAFLRKFPEEYNKERKKQRKKR